LPSFPAIEAIFTSITGTKKLLEYSKKSKSKFIFFSSSEIYGNPDKKNIPTKETYNGNVSSIEDRSCYDEGKRVGETLCYFYKIKEKVKLPILCKDFFIDPFQVYLAKSHGADAILIIIAGLTDKMADDIYNEALKLNMSVIVEVHTREEALKALRFKNALIGINNRNLKTLETNISTTYDIHEIVKNHSGPLISESGLKTKDEILEIKNRTKIKTFLIGESLLKKLDQNSIFTIL